MKMALKNNLFPLTNLMGDISQSEKNEFKIELIDLNFERSKKLNYVIIIFAVLLSSIDILNRYKGLWLPGSKYLFILHIIFTGILLFCLLYFRFGKKFSFKQKYSFTIFYTYFITLNCTFTSIIDQLIHGQITVYIIGALVIAILNSFEPFIIIGIYVINYLIFVIGLTIVQQNSAILRGHYINGGIVAIIAFFLSIIIFNGKAKDFLSRKTIEYHRCELEAANEQLTATNQKLRESLSALDESQNIIFTLALALESKDSYSSGHSERVAEYAVEIAKYLNLSEMDQLNIHRASILHDIGKIGIPDAILNKPSALNEEEWAIMKSHPERGEAICSKLNFAKDILPIIRYHHEHYNGKGYPDGLAEDKIPFLARLVSIADTVDAITSSRPYRSEGTFEKACAELKKGSGTQFDPALVEAFVTLYNNNISKLNLIRNKTCLS